MPGYAPPADQWVAQTLGQLKGDVQALKAQSTEYIVDSGGVCQAIIGHLVAEPNGTATGLEGWGVAVLSDGRWVNLGGALTWTVASLLNSWKTVAGGEVAAYAKDTQGFVHLRGRVQSGASGKEALELPEGYRPGKLSDYPAGALNSETPVAAAIVVSEAGVVNVYYASTITDVGLGGVSFYAEN